MIDEATLSALLRDAGDAIEIPDGGIERVLAARRRAGAGDGPSRVRRTPMRPLAGGRSGSLRRGPGRNKAIAGAIAAVVVLFVAIGVASSHHPSSNTSSGASEASPTTTAPNQGTIAAGTPTIPALPEANGASSSAGGSQSAGAPVTSAGVSGPVETTIPPASAITPLPAQVIKTGSIGVVVKTGQVGATADRLSVLAAGLGGYVQSSQSTTAGNSPTATVILRVPVANFTEMVTQAEALGKVTLVTTSGQDVTAQSVDLAAQIQALQASRDQFLQILAKAQTIGDILAVEQQISSLQTEINQLQGQQKVLNDQTSYSTLTVSVAQPSAAVIIPPPPPKPSGLSNSWAHARRSFTHGVESVVSASGGLAVFLLCAAAVSFILWLGWKVARRRLV